MLRCPELAMGSAVLMVQLYVVGLLSRPRSHFLSKNITQAYSQYMRVHVHDFAIVAEQYKSREHRQENKP